MPYRNKLLNRWTREDGTPSGASSRAESRTPMPEDDSDYEDNEEVDFQQIQDLLSKKLESLQEEGDRSLGVGGERTAGDRRQLAAATINKNFIQSSSTSVNEVIFALTRPRTEVSTSSRELLLAQLYKLIVSKPLVISNEENISSHNYVDEDIVQKLVTHFTSGNYRTATEFLYLYRSVVAIICSNIEDFAEFLSSDFMDLIEQLIQDQTTSVITNDNKANLITGYVTFLLVLHNGSSSFGIDDKIQWLVELAEGYSMSALALRKDVEAGDRDHSTLEHGGDDKALLNEAWDRVDAEMAVATSALHGAAALLTLLERGDYLNEICEDLMTKLVVLVDNDEVREIAKAAGRFIALIYEVYVYGEDDEDDDQEYNSNAPYYEQEALMSILQRLTNLSSKKVGKKDKKQFNSVFRNIYNTVEGYTDAEKRSLIYKKTPEGIELVKEIMDSTYIKLSKFKSLSINSWFLYARLRHLRWAFSFGLHSQLVANESIRDILKEPEGEFKSAVGVYDFDEAKLDSEQGYADYASDLLDQKHVLDDKSRTKKINKERVDKLTAQIEDIELTK